MSRTEKRYLTPVQIAHLESLSEKDMNPKNKAFLKRVLKQGWYFVRDRKVLNYIGY